MLSDAMPGLRLLRSYRREWLRGDLVAGLVLAAYLLPAGLGDASLAGLPPEAGLYACLFAGLVFWLFCSSRHTAITVTSAISLLVGTSLGDLAGGDAARYAALASATALIVAALGLRGLAAARGEPRELHLRDGHDRLQDRGGPAPRQHAAAQAPRVQGQPRRLLGADGARPLAPRRDEPHVSRPRRGRAGPADPRQAAAAEPPGVAPRPRGRHRRRALPRPGGPRGGPPRRGAAGPARARPARDPPLRREPAPAPGHGVLPARGGGDRRDRADVRPQARLPARQQPGVPRAGRQQPGRRPRARLPGERRDVAVAGQRGRRRPHAPLGPRGLRPHGRGHPLPRLSPARPAAARARRHRAHGGQRALQAVRPPALVALQPSRVRRRGGGDPRRAGLRASCGAS